MQDRYRLNLISWTLSLNDESDLIEARMRAALHLRRPSSSPLPAKPTGRHRFVQDGEVPVVVVNPRQQRSEDEQAALAVLEGKLAREREARQAAELALEQATATIRQLQTRLAHAEIARREATPAPVAPVPVPESVPEVEQADPPRRAESRPRRPVKAKPQAEDEPIEWWKPGWQERFRNSQG
jgi:hypothetical protein